MRTNTPIGEGTFDELRTVRALTGVMQVVETAPDLYAVYSGSGREYTVDIRDRPVCSCLDFMNREDVTACKHIRRVYVETGRVAIPATFDLTALDDFLLRGIRAGVVRVSATDGGRDCGEQTATDGESA